MNNKQENISIDQVGQANRTDAQNKIYNACVSYPVDKVQKVFAKSSLKQMQLLCLDQQYYTVTKSMWDQVISSIASNHLIYETNRFDCDKFATYFAAMCALDYGINSAGMVLDFQGQHAYNALLVAPDQDGDDPIFMVLEPQTDQYVLKPDTHHTETNGAIIFN